MESLIEIGRSGKFFKRDLRYFKEQDTKNF